MKIDSKRPFSATAVSVLAPVLLLACVSGHAQTFIFDGSVSNVWNSSENWVDGIAPPVFVAPAEGDPIPDSEIDLIFTDPSNARATTLYSETYVVRSMTFNENITSLFQTNSGVGTHTLQAGIVTIDSGVTGTVQLSGRYVIGAENTAFTNNSETIAKWEAHVMPTGSVGQVQLRGGDFETTTGSANNSDWPGGTLIENALWDVNTGAAGAQTGPFGSGDITLGEAGTLEAATVQLTALRGGTRQGIPNNLVVNSPDARFVAAPTPSFNVNGGIILHEGSLLSIQNVNVTWLRGVISGTGSLDLGGGPGITVINNENTFTGDVTLSSIAQSRANNAFGNAANIVTMNQTAFRIFINTEGNSLTVENELRINGGIEAADAPAILGVQTAGTSAAGTGTFNGDIVATQDLDLTITAASNPTIAQAITIHFNGAILDGANTANLLINGGGREGATSTIHLNGANVIGGSTAINVVEALGTMQVNLNGSLSNANVTVAAGAELTGSGTLFYNINGTESDLITVNGGLDIAGLSIDFEEITSGATEASYVIANYSGGTLMGAEFAAVLDLPAGYEIDYDFNGAGQIALVSTGGPVESFQTWMDGLATADLPPEGQRGPQDAPAGDGATNLLKYALGILPLAPVGEAGPKAVVVSVEDDGVTTDFLALQLVRSTSAAVELVVDRSDSLTAWGTASFTTEILETVGENRERVNLITDIVVEGEAKYFLRLQVTSL